jgi:NSS family neurotransmitter:Na+ symporter
MDLREEQRESWGSRSAFVLAAIGSAVGLGNLWGFPYKLYANGGGAFLIPYLVALVLIGIPLLILEFALGHRFQRAAPDAFRRIHPRFEFIGWWGVLLGFLIITYYPVILAYCFSFFFYSLQSLLTGHPLPWAGEGLEGVQSAKSFFFDRYLHYQEGFHLGPLQHHLVVVLAITWIAMFLCIFRGVGSVGKVVQWTVPLPWLMLVILAVRGLTLPGAWEGLAFYLNPEWSELLKPATWRVAFGQVFFSLSLAFGVMITYAGFLHRRSDLNNNATLIALADLATSVVAGMAVFATLGGMAFVSRSAGHPIPVREVVTGGPGLAFVAFPYALAQLPWPAFFSVVFFVALLTLGIDSAFSISETVLASLVDKTGWRRIPTLVGISVAGFALGLFYITRGGLNWLGLLDSFVNGSWGIPCMGLLECLVLGWLYRLERLRRHANMHSDWRLPAAWNLVIRIVSPAILAALVVWNVLDDLSRQEGYLRTPSGAWVWPNVMGLLIVLVVPVFALVLNAVPSVRPERPPEKEVVANPSAGRLPLAVALLGGLLVLLAMPWPFVSLSLHARVSPSLLLTLAALCALAGLLPALTVTLRHDPIDDSPSWKIRWAGVLGVTTLGTVLGLFLFRLSRSGVSPAPPTSDSETAHLTPAGWIMLALLLLMIVGGLSWCFYRAIRATLRKPAPAPATE